MALAITLAAVVTGCDSFHASGITGKTIRYQVEYTNSPEAGLDQDALSITYSTNDGQQGQKAVTLPWTKSIGTAKPGFKASVKAQFDGYGTIACRIVADGKVIQNRVSAEEPYPVVECST